jgi:hypothetical protein
VEETLNRKFAISVSSARCLKDFICKVFMLLVCRNSFESESPGKNFTEECRPLSLPSKMLNKFARGCKMIRPETVFNYINGPSVTDKIRPPSHIVIIYFDYR